MLSFSFYYCALRMEAGMPGVADSITTEEFLTERTSFGSNLTRDGPEFFLFYSRRTKLSCDSRMVMQPSSVSMRGGGETVCLDV